MPRFVMIGWDGPRGAKRRDQHRRRHIDYIAGLHEHGKIVIAGPIKDETGDKSVGVVIVFEADNLDEAGALVAADPYVAGGVFASYEVRPFKQVFPPEA